MANSLDIELTRICSDFFGEIREQVDEELEKIGSETVTELKNTSPKRLKHTKGRRYSASWFSRTEKNGRGTTVTVANRKWQLTHLLEYGHLNRDGTTYAEKFPHIENANREAQRKFTDFIGGGNGTE